MTHTQGPWELHIRGKYDVSIERQGVLICNPSLATDNAGLAPGEDESNARLIAAAPELLAALELTVAAINGFMLLTASSNEIRKRVHRDNCLPALEQARAAIAKATQP